MRISDNALVAAATLAKDILTIDFFLTATDLIDEAAKIEYGHNFKPEEIDEIDRKVLQFEMENYL